MPMYALRASSVGLGGPPAPAHMVSSRMTGPRGPNGASPFMYAHPERDIDSTPQAIPTPRSPALIAWATLIVALIDEPQYRLRGAPPTVSAKPPPRWVTTNCHTGRTGCEHRRAQTRQSSSPSRFPGVH